MINKINNRKLLSQFSDDFILRDTSLISNTRAYRRYLYGDPVMPRMKTDISSPLSPKLRTFRISPQNTVTEDSPPREVEIGNVKSPKQVKLNNLLKQSASLKSLFYFKNKEKSTKRQKGSFISSVASGTNIIIQPVKQSEHKPQSKHLMPKQMPLTQVYYEKIDIDQIKFEIVVNSICCQINELIGDLKNSLSIYKVLFKLFTPEILTIMMMFLDMEKRDLLEQYTFEAIKNKLIHRSFIIFKALSYDIKMHPVYKGKKPGQCLMYQIGELHSRIYQSIQKRKAIKIDIMKNQILNQITSVAELSLKLKLKHLIRKQVQITTHDLSIPEFEPLAIASFPIYQPGSKLDNFEIINGKFSNLSQSERRFNFQLSSVINELKSFKVPLNE